MKFLINAEQFAAFQPFLEEYMRPDKFCLDGKEYGIYNIYYDTADDFLIRESLSKPYYKEKLRLRSYMSPAAPGDTVFLEIKKKIGGIVNKRRITLTLDEAMAYMEHGTPPELEGKYMQEQVFEEIEDFLRRYKVVPKEYVSYQRAAFFGKDDPDFRITFDREMIVRNYDVTLEKACYGDRIVPESERLMELKVGDSIPYWLANAIADLGLHKTSFSKYGNAYQMHLPKPA